MIVNNTADKITRSAPGISAQKTSEKDSSKTGSIGFVDKMPKEKCISPEKRQQIIDELRLMKYYLHVRMEYQKIITLLNNTTSTINYWVEICNDARGAHNTIGQIKFKTTLLESGLCDYSDAYMLVKRTITVVGQGANSIAIAADRNKKEEIFKNRAPFTDYISKIINKQVDNAKEVDIVM